MKSCDKQTTAGILLLKTQARRLHKYSRATLSSSSSMAAASQAIQSGRYCASRAKLGCVSVSSTCDCTSLHKHASASMGGRSYCLSNRLHAAASVQGGRLGLRPTRPASSPQGPIATASQCKRCVFTRIGNRMDGAPSLQGLILLPVLAFLSSRLLVSLASALNKINQCTRLLYP